MSDIYVPIDTTEVRNVLPEGEEIIYSTLCSGYYTLRSATTKPQTMWFDSHLLITEKSFAYTIGISGEAILYYRPLNQMLAVRGRKFRLKAAIGKSTILKYAYGKEKYRDYYFKLVRDKSVEAKEKFKERAAEFENKFVSLILESNREFLASPDSHILSPKERQILVKSLRKMEKREDKQQLKDQ